MVGARVERGGGEMGGFVGEGFERRGKVCWASCEAAECFGSGGHFVTFVFPVEDFHSCAWSF